MGLLNGKWAAVPRSPHTSRPDPLPALAGHSPSPSRAARGGSSTRRPPPVLGFAPRSRSPSASPFVSASPSSSWVATTGKPSNHSQVSFGQARRGGLQIEEFSLFYQWHLKFQNVHMSLIGEVVASREML
jgi:hypothetical protein